MSVASAPLVTLHARIKRINTSSATPAQREKIWSLMIPGTRNIDFLIRK